MKHLNLFLIAGALALTGCHLFKSEPKQSAASKDGPRKIASNPEAEALFSQYDRDITTGKCNDQIQHYIKGYGAERSWITGPADLDGSRMYLSPTRIIGRWIGVRKYMSGEMQFYVLTRDKQEVFSFSETCARTKDVRNKSYVSYVAEGGQEFTDKELEALVERTASFGVIYVWSPHMGYSYTQAITPEGAVAPRGQQQGRVSGIDNARAGMEKARERMGVAMSMTVIADSRAGRGNIRQAFDRGNHDLKAEHLKKMASFELMMRSMGQHYPSLLVYGNGKIFRQIKPGVAGVEAYQKFIEDAVTELKK